MPRIDKEKFELLVENSKLSKEELLKHEILKSEKSLVSVTMGSLEYKAYQKYCFKRNIYKSELSRKLLTESLENPDQVFKKELRKPVNRKIHTFLVKIELKDELRSILSKTENTKLLSESEYMRRCILLFMEKEGVKY